MTNPILLLSFLITKTSVEFCPTNGSLNSVTFGVLPTSNLKAPLFLLIVNLWPDTKGWFGIWIVRVGIDTLLLTFPINLFTFIALPVVVPIPTDWGPLKYIFSLLKDSNLFVLTGSIASVFKKSTFEPDVCATPTFLLTLNALLIGKTFSTSTVSVSTVFPEPILTELPADTSFGISVKKISCIKPLAEPTVIVDANDTLSVETPTL